MEILQYANSPRISQLLDDIKYYFNDENFWNDFYTKIWNIETATKIGLDIWGAIVNIPRNLDTDEGIYSLNDEQYRKVILLGKFYGEFGRTPKLQEEYKGIKLGQFLNNIRRGHTKISEDDREYLQSLGIKLVI